MSNTKDKSDAVLVLEDGTVFDGACFGKRGETVGEVVLYTGVVGYQEVITDPSYRGAIVIFTYPIIGSYGVNNEDNESSAAQTAGVIISEYSAFYSNFRATGPLEDFLVKNGVVGIKNVDTRAVAVHIRDHGEMLGMVTCNGDAPAKLLNKLKKSSSPWSGDIVGKIQPASPSENAVPGKLNVAVYDLGVKQSLLQQLTELGCKYHIFSASCNGDEILSSKPDGVILAGGPGDPGMLGGIIGNVKLLLGKIPVLGIGLGHQALALALGCKVERMKIGHHGLNYPVKDMDAGIGRMTVQHHSFVVSGGSIPSGVEVICTNINDGSVEGIKSRDFASSSVQFHPSHDEKGRPSDILAKFLKDSCGGK